VGKVIKCLHKSLSQCQCPKYPSVYLEIRAFSTYLPWGQLSRSSYPFLSTQRCFHYPSWKSFE